MAGSNKNQVKKDKSSKKEETEIVQQEQEVGPVQTLRSINDPTPQPFYL